MKKYLVTIFLMVDPSRDVNPDKPKLKQVQFAVEADNDREAYNEACNLDTSNLSIWDYTFKKISDEEFQKLTVSLKQ